MRKTFHIQIVLKEFNYQLDNPHIDKDTKRLLCTMIESLLMQYGVYNGFRFNVTAPKNITPDHKRYYDRTYFAKGL